jgi:predicted DNA-binding transcriptional regulator YafY
LLGVPTNGSYELRIPYREFHELVMDILRQGAGAEVLSPNKLREDVKEHIRTAMLPYA